MTAFTSTYLDTTSNVKNCDIDYSLWFANGTQVLPGSSVFEFPSAATTTSIGQLFQGDNNFVGVYPLTFKGSIRYG
jgi:hypothetical protein